MLKFKSVVVGALAVNCYICYCDETMEGVIIDPGADSGKIISLAERLGVKVKAILLTHAHFDHSADAGKLKEEYNVPILINEAEEEILEDAYMNLSEPFTGVPMTLKADGLFKDGDEISFGRQKLKVIHTPGHTQGSSCFFSGETLFAGDTLFCNTYGRIDFPTGDGETLARSIKKLYGLDDNVTVLPGHNEATTIGREKCRIMR